MKRMHDGKLYESVREDDDIGGSASMELYCSNQRDMQSATRVARVIYWDASGHFYLETFGCEVVLNIVEELISEAKSNILLR